MARGRFSAALHKRARKTNNAPKGVKAKIKIREHVLEAIGAANAVVFDAFAGDGKMHQAVWKRARKSVGCDTVWYRDGRLAYAADNRRVMRAIDLNPFNIFDLDAHGSPWEQACILADRRELEPGERIGIVLTEGSSLKVRMGGFPHALLYLARINPGARGGSRQQGLMINRAINGLCEKLGGVVEKRWEARGRTASKMCYIGLVVRAKKEAAPKGGQGDRRPATRRRGQKPAGDLVQPDPGSSSNVGKPG